MLPKEARPEKPAASASFGGFECNRGVWFFGIPRVPFGSRSGRRTCSDTLGSLSRSCPLPAKGDCSSEGGCWWVSASACLLLFCLGQGIQEQWQQLHPLDQTAALDLCIRDVSGLLQEGLRTALVSVVHLWDVKVVSWFWSRCRSSRCVSQLLERSLCAVGQAGDVQTLLSSQPSLQESCSRRWCTQVS